MVTVFNPQALSDPGPTAASGLISSGMGTASNMLMNRSQNRMNLINQLLQSGGLAAREYLTRKNEQEQGQDTLQALIDTGMIPAGTKDKPYQIPEGANIDPKALTSVAGQYGPLAQLRAANYYANIGKTGSETGSPYGNEILEYGLRKAQEVGGIKPTATGGAEPSPSYDPTTGTYIAGASEQPRPQNLIEQKARLAVETQREELNKTIREQKTKKLYADELGNNDVNAYTKSLQTYRQAPDKPPVTYAINGRTLQNNEMAQVDRTDWLRTKQGLSSKELFDIEQSYTKKKVFNKELLALYQEIRPYVAKGALQQIANNIRVNPNYLATVKDPIAAKIFALDKALRGQKALEIAVATQGSKPAKDDVDAILRGLPDILSNQQVFDEQLGMFLGQNTINTINEGIVFDKVADVKDLGTAFEKTFNKPYEYGEVFASTPERALEAFKPLPQRQSQAPRPSDKAMNRVNQAKGQPVPAAGGSSQLSKAKLLLQQMEEQDNAAAGKIIRAR
jgi:hypothetical protein